jgi:hypothetical protein
VLQMKHVRAQTDHTPTRVFIASGGTNTPSFYGVRARVHAAI